MQRVVEMMIFCVIKFFIPLNYEFQQLFKRFCTKRFFKKKIMLNYKKRSKMGKKNSSGAFLMLGNKLTKNKIR